MRLLRETHVVRIRLSGLSCRSKERLLTARLAEVPGVKAAALGDGDVLTALLDTRDVDIDRLSAAIVGAGLVPEDLLEAPAPAMTTDGGPYVR
ncbi:MAG TPA: hypothetical protein VGK50_06010 [Coriobacteriia bacterium]|jgi:hypothetical protein